MSRQPRTYGRPGEQARSGEAAGFPSSIRNTVAIESPHGLRSFTLHVGDVVQSMDAVLVVPSHAYAGSALTGQVLDAVRTRYGIDFDNLDPLVAPRTGYGTFRVSSTKPAPYSEILVVRIPGVRSVLQGGHEPVNVIQEVLWTLFGSLAALELRTDALKSIALPLLAGTRGYEVRDLMGAIIEHSIAWLKVSRFMKAVNFYVPEEDAVAPWSKAMDDVLGRRFIDTAQNQLAGALREEILARLGTSHQEGWPAAWQPCLRDIEQDLQQPKVSLERLAGNCRKLAEYMVITVAAEDGVPLSNNVLADSIAELRRKKLVAPWILSHLDCLRVFGNAAVHTGDQVTYTPPRLTRDDLLALLASLQRMLAFAESRYRHL